MEKLKLKNLYFGKTDAYNEFVSFGKDTCKELFFEFPNIDIASVLKGDVYYFCGDKGTGKTMLLKYIETIVQEQEEPTFTSFIRFKKEVDDDQRNIIKRTGTMLNTEEVVDNNQNIDPSVDCVLAWQVYLIKTIIFNLEKSEYGVFVRNDKWEVLCTLLHGLYGDIDDKAAKRTIIPKIKRGNVDINLGNRAKVNLELEWVDHKKKSVSFKSIAQKIIDSYESLSCADDSMYVFIDELELSLKKNKQYERDIILIRDLIFAIQFLSETSKENGYNVYFLAAIRNEVYKSVQAIGKEINKPIHDFGVQITWKQSGGNIKDHPLLQMLRKRIEYSERVNDIVDTKDVWSKYFVKELYNKSIYNYIINQTWNKPRDVIRLFTIIQKQYGDKTFIDQELFEGVKQQYSTESWEELVEALSAQYSDVEIEGIRHVLTGISLPFTKNEFSVRVRKLCDEFREVEILNKRNISHVLSDLYDIGVIGNYAHVPRFVFLGDRDIDHLAQLTIHYPLIKYFRASMKAFENKSDYTLDKKDRQ